MTTIVLARDPRPLEVDGPEVTAHLERMRALGLDRDQPRWAYRVWVHRLVLDVDGRPAGVATSQRLELGTTPDPYRPSDNGRYDR